ncbi:MAG: GMP synthase [Weeksellaceae bacterium]
MKNQKIKIALLDMNDNVPNQGMKDIIALTESFVKNSNLEISYAIFDVRHKSEVPKVKDFEIFISSGGPGTPHKVGEEWEEKYTNFLDEIWENNLNNSNKKYLLLICHSFQMAVIHWNLAKVEPRESFSFGILPIYKTRLGENEILFKNLGNPFYAVDSRSFQCVRPKLKKIKQLGMKLVAIERIRPNQKLERAVMAIRFSKEIFGTQFHPEANSEDVMCKLVDENYKKILIEKIGLDNYKVALERADDEDKLFRTQAEIIPGFLKNAVEKLNLNL